MKIHKGLGDGSIYGIDAESFQRNYPFNLIYEGYPDKFAVIRELQDGTITVRMNKYPVDKTRIEIEFVAVPRDLLDSAGSIPLVPRKHIAVLEDATTFYLMLDKSDDRAQIYANLVQANLTAMISQNRGSEARTGEWFGQIIPRPDLIERPRTLRDQDPYS
jgi:hypothetical protein